MIVVDRKRLVWAHDGRHEATFGRFFFELGAERRKLITHVNADAASWTKVVEARCPQFVRRLDRCRSTRLRPSMRSAARSGTAPDGPATMPTLAVSSPAAGGSGRTPTISATASGESSPGRSTPLQPGLPSKGAPAWSLASIHRRPRAPQGLHRWACSLPAQTLVVLANRIVRHIDAVTRRSTVACRMR